MPQNAHNFVFSGLAGGSLPLKAYAGRAVLIVNVASQCGLTPQYAGLQRLWSSYAGRGLTVLGVPSNDFGGQEPGSAAEIESFCRTQYAVGFPLAGKEHVLGENAHPFYRWIAKELGEDAAPRWNFHKYLIAKDGALIGTFASRMPPDAPEIVSAIEAALA